MRLRIGAVEYDNVPKLLQRVPVLHWLELEEQSGITGDQLDAGTLGWRTTLLCYVFLLRRNNGDVLTFRELAADLVPEDVIVPDETDETDETDDGAAAPDPTPASGGGPSPI